MYNFHFSITPKKHLHFVDRESIINITNITKGHLAYKVNNIIVKSSKVRTTDSNNFKVVESKGIIDPQQCKEIKIISLSQVLYNMNNIKNIADAKFQILTILINPNDDIDKQFQQAHSELIQKIILKTSGGTLSETMSLSSSINQGNATTFLGRPPELELCQSPKVQHEQAQSDALKLYLIGLLCFILGYVTRCLQL